MAIIIKGKMPKGISKNCCFCGYARGGDWNITCGITGNIIDVGFCAPKQKDCPIIGKIPDVHGDLIDKDTLRKAFENQIANGSITVKDIFRIIDESAVVLGAST